MPLGAFLRPSDKRIEAFRGTMRVSPFLNAERILLTLWSLAVIAPAPAEKLAAFAIVCRQG